MRTYAAYVPNLVLERIAVDPAVEAHPYEEDFPAVGPSPGSLRMYPHTVPIPVSMRAESSSLARSLVSALFAR
jgi:hypothetical protein